MDLFAKSSTLINCRISFKNYKMWTRENWDQSKDRTDMFEDDENANAKKNNRATVDSNYDSNNM